MSDEGEKLLDKLKILPLEELIRYEHTARIMNKIVNVAGVAVILFMISFINIFTIIAGLAAVYFAGNISASLDDTILLIRKNVERRFPDK